MRIRYYTTSLQQVSMIEIENLFLQHLLQWIFLFQVTLKEVNMEFKRIDENKFQCRLLKEDLEDNNITLDDFFRNDTTKMTWSMKRV